jgi:hypothetical protein
LAFDAVRLVGAATGPAFVGARLAGVFFGGVDAGLGEAGPPWETGSAFGFEVTFAAAGGFAGGLGVGLSRRVVMARASRAGLDPARDQ